MAVNDSCLKLRVTNQYANLQDYKEININNATSPLYIDGEVAKVPSSDLLKIQKYVVDDIMHRINVDADSNIQSLDVFQSIYQFLKWKHQKLLLNIKPYIKKTNVYENGIYWASLGTNVGSELNKNRPVLVWKKRCSGKDEANYSYIVIPITTKHKNKKYYMNVPIDINGLECHLRIEDMRRINIRRFTRPILDNGKNLIFISADKRKEIQDAIQKFYIFENKYTHPDN